MVSIDRVQRGVSRYLDTELVGKMDGLNKWLFAAAASAYIGSAPALLDKLRSNKLLAPLNLVNEAGEVDVEKMYAHLKPAAAKCPAPITLPVGTITLTEADVDAIYNYIMQS